jgi:HD superfamily phosphodiesterase
MKLGFYLSKDAELEALYEQVEHDFLTKGLVHHNWNHVLRDVYRSIKIGEAENAKMKIVLASVLLHDIGRLHPEEGKDHYAAGAKIAFNLLKKTGFAEQEVEETIHCIRSHGPRGLEEPRTLEAEVCFDVDVLSHSCGNIGVARVFHYFIAEEKFTIKQMMQIGSGRRGPRKSFYTKTGRTLGKEGYSKAVKFWRDLDRELKHEERNVRKVIDQYEGD